MGLAVDIVKHRRKNHSEKFDTDKLLRSIRSACLSVHCPEGQAESTANHVTGAVIAWLDTRPFVTSHDIRLIASRHLERFHPDAAYIFLNQRRMM